MVAHRGDSGLRAEHTLAAYEAALTTGADGLECDVRLTRDGHLVCVHDRRVERTSNGYGVVSELDLAGLRELDFASWREKWPDSADDLLSDEPYLQGVAPDRQPGGVLTLETLLGLIADAGRPVRLLIETKHPTRYAGLVEKELVRTLRRFGVTGSDGASPVTVMSFASTALRRVRLLAPDLPTVLLFERWAPGRRGGDLPTGTEIAGPSLALLREYPGYVARAHERGAQVYCWTVNDPEDISYVLSLGVNAVITNYPAAAMRIRDAPAG